jgi:hypothetical protein
LKGKNIPNIFRDKVVATSVYFLNKCPKRSVKNMNILRHGVEENLLFVI